MLDCVAHELGPGLELAYVEQRTSQQALEQAEQAMEQWRASWERIGEDLGAAERAIGVEDARLEQLTAQGQRLEKEQQKHAEERATLTFGEIEERLVTLVGNDERLVAACDEATRALMVGFYRRLKVGAGRTEALRQAQLALLRSGDHTHPYFWAGFIASGRWDPLAGAP